LLSVYANAKWRFSWHMVFYNARKKRGITAKGSSPLLNTQGLSVYIRAACSRARNTPPVPSLDVDLKIIATDPCLRGTSTLGMKVAERNSRLWLPVHYTDQMDLIAQRDLL
jgi:hypothetical protein